MKVKFKRVLSGMLTAVTLLSTVFQPMMANAASLDQTKEKPPLYEEIKDQLDASEVVTAEDLELEFASEFDPKTDFEGIKITDETKVKVTFKEAKNEQDEDFSTSRADTYKAIYYVEPVEQTHPTYQINRKIIVKEAETEVSSQTEGTTVSDSGGDEESEEDGESDSESQPTEIVVEETAELAMAEDSALEEAAEDAITETDVEVLSEEEFDTELEATEDQETVDPETGITLSEVLEDAAEQEVELADLEVGETVTFTMSASLLAASAVSTGSQDVSITRGSWYSYADYGLGSYITAPYYVTWGSVKATAYCVQPSKSGPDDGTYKIKKLSDGKVLAKVCYYGTKASDENGFFDEKHKNFSAGKRFIITHLAASYANGSSDWASGTNATGQSLAMELYNYCVSMPEIPDVEMSFSEDSVTAYVDGNSQRTKSVTFHADTLQTITFNLPSGVKLVNETTGKTSKAGASVEISGGTKFYLTAPLTQASDVSATFSTKMRGSIDKEFSAYKITTGSSTQDLALVFGEGVGSEKFVTFSVTWVSQAKIEIVKSDRSSNKAIAGAVYGIYSDAAGTNLIATMPATDANGASSLTIEKTQDTVYLKEISVPAGYMIDATAYNIALVVGGTTKQVVTDQEQLAALTVYKEGEVLTGASVTEDGVTFQYSNQRLKGAVYNVYAAESITAADGTVVYKKGAIVIEGLTTGEDGSAMLDNLHLGVYTVTETKAPANFICNGESQTITLSYGGQTVEKVFGNITFVNDRQKAAVSVVKQDDTTKNPLSGGIYGLYAAEDIKDVSGNVVVKKDTLIEKATTKKDGQAAYKADLPVNYSYYVKEIQAPANYYRNTEARFDFAFKYSNDIQATQEFSYTFENERVNAEISLTKKDKKTGNKTQGDATFEGAVYGLYAREAIVHPDGRTGVLYEAGSQVATLTTDAKGNAKVENLYLGKYYIKEITAPIGYLLDEKEYDLECNDEGDLVKTVKREATSEEQVIEQPFQVIKAANNGKTDADLLSGVGFSAWLVSSLKTNDDGSYDFSSAETVVLTADGKTEMFTDEKGYAQSIAIPYGTYVVRETTTPHNYTPVDDFIVTITEHHPTEPQTWRVLLDDEFEAKLKIIKKDDETKKSVLLANTEFKIYDLDHQKYVEQVTTYPKTKTHKSYFTDEAGYLILPNNLKIGNYRIEEVTAPEGYTINTNYVEISVDSNTAYQMDGVSGDVLIEVAYENHPVKGKLTIVKSGEVLTGFDKDFQYQEQNLEGAVFEVYAAEDFYTADHQVDENGSRTLEYAKGTLVATVTTDANGNAVVENLPLGTYTVKEQTAPNGFVLNTVLQDVTFAYADQDTPVVRQEVTFQNDRQKVSISVVKQDAENEAVVAGATFGLYAAEDIKVGDNVIVAADTLLEEAVSDADGKAAFTQDLPLSQYYVKEIKAPAGYVSSDEVLTFDASYQGQNIPTVELSAVKKNEPTTVEITKSDITTGVELDSAKLSVLDKEGKVVDEWVSVKDAPHIIKRLTAGESYTLREEFAPYGYLKATDVKFTVEDTTEVQKVEMKDEVPTALLIINKKGEFLDKITLLDRAKGTVEHFFEYVSGNLTEVTFEIYVAEDIKAADGVSEDYYKADELVGTITTDENGVAQLGNLPVGKYYVKEVETAHGYVLDGEVRYVDLSYVDQGTAIVTYGDVWQNERQKVQINVLKKEKDTGRVLEGAIIGLYAAEDIKSESGKVLLEANTLIEQKQTDANGQITFNADLPIDTTYYVKEIFAPDGFVTADQREEFTFEYKGAEQQLVTFEFVFENEATTSEFTKTDLTAGKELPGAHLQVTDSDGNVVDEWVSTEEAHVIKELVVGKEYTMTETKPADGYVTAESITFMVENTTEIQKHEMQDDVTKVQISKTDMTTGKELPGAKLTILNENGEVVENWTSTEEPHYIEKLPIGQYTLREETAPDGYLVAEDVAFEVTDTAEIQKVEMKDDVTKVQISKTDLTTGKELPGAKLTILNEKGEVVESWTSEEEPHYIEKLPVGKYILREEAAPDGYLVAEDVAFEVKATSEIQKVEMKDQPKTPETQENTDKPDTPKTGDDRPFGVWMLFAACALCGIGGSAYYLRKKKK